MPITLDEFVQSITASSLMDAEEIQSFLDTLPMEQRPNTAEDLAREMYRAGKLTKFQAQAIYQKKTRGLVVGNYVVLDKLGKGGMGAVYKAQHKRMKRIVALKMLPSSATKSSDAVKRFQREMEAAAKLTHPNIVTAHDADEAKGVHFLVMEYVEGQDLYALVKEKGTLSVARAVDYTIQAAKGLEYAHSQGVIHRDIKPHNLLLDKNGTLKILDMGLARIGEAAGDAVDDDGLTRSGQVMGTLDYMSPEQALDTKTADARADIYSLGCTLHYLLIGRSPYGGDTVTKKILAHRMEPVPSLQQLRSDVPQCLNVVFQRMLAKEPNDRQQTMSEVTSELQACVLPQGNALVPPSLPSGPGSYAETVAFQREDTAPSAESLSPFDELFAGESVQISERLIAPSRRYGKRWTKQQKAVIAAVAGGVAVVVLLLGIILKMRTSEGTLVVEISEPDATVQVLNEQGKVLIERKGQKGTLTIGVAPGQRRLRVERDGFEVFAKELTIASGGKEEIKAKLEPVAVAQAKDIDREAAEWVLGKGGTLWVVVNGETKNVTTTAELPQADFKVASIFLLGNKSVGDDLSVHLRGLTDLSRLDIPDTQVTNQGIEQLKSIGNLGWLGLGGTGANDATLEYLGQMKGLQYLDLDRTAITDVGLGHLEGLVNLTGLAVQGTQVSNAGLKHLKGMRLLRALHLSRTNVTDTGLADLQGLESLAALELASVKVTDSGLQHLTGLPNLRSLNLTGTQIGDSGLAYLRGMKRLESLDLLATKVTDQGLQHLKELQGLTHVGLQGTSVTAAGVATLTAALPNAKITVSPEVQAELDKLMKPPPVPGSSTATPSPSTASGESIPVSPKKPVEPSSSAAEDFLSLFDGKTLNGWHKIGVGDWSVENGNIVGRNAEPHSGFGHLVTDAQFGDFTVRLKFKVPKGNSGLYFRCSEGGWAGITGPQADIAPPDNVGSLFEADADPGTKGRILVPSPSNSQERYFVPNDWNDLRLEARGNRISAFINDVKTAEWQQDHGPTKGPLAIQMAGDVPELWFKDIEIHDYDRKTSQAAASDRAASTSPAPGANEDRPRPAVAPLDGVNAWQNQEGEQSVEVGFVSLFDGKTLNGWKGWTDRYRVQDEKIIADFGSQPYRGPGGHLFTEKEYKDFVLRLEYSMSPAVNNGILLRAPPSEKSWQHAVEVQLLDDSFPEWQRLSPSSLNGALFNIVAVKPGHLKPTGQWNSLEIMWQGRQVRVTLNGAVVVDTDLDDPGDKVGKGLEHPGLKREQGHLVLMGYASQGKVEFRNIRIKELSPQPSAAEPAGPVRGGKTAVAPPASETNRRAVELRANDWIGLPQCWRMNRQGIMGSTGQGIDFNTFLCSKKTYRNFELSCQVRLIAGNTGVQFRSDYVDQAKFVLRGPQVDLGPGCWGNLFGEKMGTTLKQAPAELVKRIVKPDAFNDVFVRCVGKHVTVKINNETTVDGDFPAIADEGVIGLQLLSGKTEALFRNVRLKELGDSTP